MRNLLDKFGENQNKHLMIRNVYSEKDTVMRYWGKIY